MEEALISLCCFKELSLTAYAVPFRIAAATESPSLEWRIIYVAHTSGVGRLHYASSKDVGCDGHDWLRLSSLLTPPGDRCCGTAQLQPILGPL